MSTELWYTERYEEHGASLSLKIREVLHREQSPYQTIEIFETEHFGTLMTLDGLVMVTDRDNYLYHEMMSHPALFTHPAPKRVLIIGGGDCGTLREVLRHQEVEEATQVELDERVTRVAERFFPELCEKNHDPRAHFHFTDGIAWIKEAPAGRYDVIIVDSTDPVGPAAGLFATDFYTACYHALAEQGVLVAQSESPLLHADLIRQCHSRMTEAGFDAVNSVYFPQFCYPSGWWSGTLGRKGLSMDAFRAEDAKAFTGTHYYHAGMQQAAQVAPAFLLG
ncbi:polyamine aminopropyltransferase [Acidithiobacillus sp.]|uniref:polyamine aminopropyltransferase n=1 Tax=Acidithiobacillus sp. TaxID=1872118 RepID=UPI002602E6C8|nr:polyamine aminopropyltransferase [Acidithiobacillus sp.]MDD2748914.1 polyamine aminopropyltransferase [Acidithiobacillus sp.]MDD5278384.1 polyamine aminopropyltransferase [Acidithiobacillus sp.]